MTFGKIHHWLMMGAMVLMASAAAAATYGGSTTFLNIAWTYVKHITVGGLEVLGPALKGLGAAVGNLGAMVGIDPGTLTAFEPSSIASVGHAGHGAAVATASAAPSAAFAPPVTGVEAHAAGHGAAVATPTGAEAGSLTQTFTSRSEWFSSLGTDLQAQFQQQASAFGKSLAEVTAEYCNSNGLLVPAAW